MLMIFRRLSHHLRRRPKWHIKCYYYSPQGKKINSPPIHEYSVCKTPDDDSLVPRRSRPQSKKP